MPAGRPTKFTDTTLTEAKNYIINCNKNNKVPTASGLAVLLDVSKSTIYKWAETNQEFSDTLELLQDYQEEMLIQGGLSNNYNPTITKLMLANHGYSDKQEIDQTVKGAVQFVNDVPRPGSEDNQST